MRQVPRPWPRDWNAPHAAQDAPSARELTLPRYAGPPTPFGREPYGSPAARVPHPYVLRPKGRGVERAYARAIASTAIVLTHAVRRLA